MVREKRGMRQRDRERALEEGDRGRERGVEINTKIILAEVEVGQQWALSHHSCKPTCSFRSEGIASEVEVSQRRALSPEHSCKIVAEIEVSQRCALRQH